MRVDDALGDLAQSAWPVVQFGKEAIQTRGQCVAKNAPLLADRPDPSLRKNRLLQDDKAN